MTDKRLTTDVESVVRGEEQSNGCETSVEAIEKIPTRAREPWHMTEEVHRRNERDEESGEPTRRLGVPWHNLTVKGISSNATCNENVVSQLYPLHRDNKSKPLKTIIDNSSGCVKPSGMLLVLGRPGSGCTTLLSVLFQQPARLRRNHGKCVIREHDSRRGEELPRPDHHEYRRGDFLSDIDR